jgi:glucose/arabinose dehydrogenase
MGLEGIIPMKHQKVWFIVVALLLTGIPTFAQEGKFTNVEIAGHIHEPAKLAPTDEQLRERIRLPEGFHLQRFAEGLDNPRMIAVAEDGTVYVTQRKPGSLMMLRDLNDDGRADVQKVVAHIDQLHGITIRDKKIYLVDVKNVYAGDLQPDGSVTNIKTIIDNLPHAGQHPNRTLNFGPDGMLYISVGSTFNACHETGDEFATLLRTSPEGGMWEIFASGLRNTIGFGWHPGSNRLYGLDHGIDWLGDNVQSEELNEIVQGDRYG